LIKENLTNQSQYFFYFSFLSFPSFLSFHRDSPVLPSFSHFRAHLSFPLRCQRPCPLCFIPLLLIVSVGAPPSLTISLTGTIYHSLSFAYQTLLSLCHSRAAAPPSEGRSVKLVLELRRGRIRNTPLRHLTSRLLMAIVCYSSPRSAPPPPSLPLLGSEAIQPLPLL
jgi:hypothetical protein